MTGAAGRPEREIGLLPPSNIFKAVRSELVTRTRGITMHSRNV